MRIAAALLTVAAVLLGDSNCAPADRATMSELRIEILSNPEGVQVSIAADAYDANGVRSINITTGRHYPDTYVARTPHTHSILYTPNAPPITLVITATSGGAEGDLLACNVYDNGRRVDAPGPVPFSVIRADGLVSNRVECAYTTKG